MKVNAEALLETVLLIHYCLDFLRQSTRSLGRVCWHRLENFWICVKTGGF